MKKKTVSKQKTKTNYEIPIPKRGDVLGLFKKAATRQEKSKRPRSPKKKGLK